MPSSPIIFSKVPESVVRCGSAVIIDPEVSQAADYEAELAVIIGKGAHRIHAKDAFDHVWGYTIINDVTARDLQGRYSQWLITFVEMLGFTPMKAIQAATKHGGEIMGMANELGMVCGKAIWPTCSWSTATRLRTCASSRTRPASSRS